MKLSYRNVTVEIPDDDPRVAVIELLLFGRSTLPFFVPPTAQAAPVTPPSNVKVPEKFRKFWLALKVDSRRELALLAEGARQVDDLADTLLLRGNRPLQGLHNATNRVARAHRIGQVLCLSGHDREHRRVWISEEHALWVRALAQAGPAAIPPA